MSDLGDIHARLIIKAEQADHRYNSDYYSRKGLGDDDELYRKEQAEAYAWAAQQVKDIFLNLIGEDEEPGRTMGPGMPSFQRDLLRRELREKVKAL